MALNSDSIQAVKKALGSLNVGVNAGVVLDADVNGADTFAVFYANVAAPAATVSGEAQNALKTLVLPGLNLGNALGILTDTNLNGLTTVAAVQALFTAQDGALGLTYSGDSIQ